MATTIYDHLADTTYIWFCPSCGVQNHSTILYDIPAAMLEVYTHKIQMIPAPYLAAPVVIAHLSPVPQPRHLEVKPLPPHLSPHQYIPKKKKFRIFTMSCQSIHKKGKSIDVLVETTSPDTNDLFCKKSFSN